MEDQNNKYKVAAIMNVGNMTKLSAYLQELDDISESLESGNFDPEDVACSIHDYVVQAQSCLSAAMLNKGHNMNNPELLVTNPETYREFQHSGDPEPSAPTLKVVK